MKKEIIYGLVFGIILFSNTILVDAADYYISPTGTASWDSCIGTPVDGAAACSLKTANSNVQPGDVVNFRAGTYTPTDRTDCIHPGTSGNSTDRITYQSYNNESVILDGSDSYFSQAILFSAGWNTIPEDGRSYITIRGITFQNWNFLADFYYASYNEIAHCTFLGHVGDGTNTNYAAIEIYYNSKHNFIHDNTFSNFGHYVGRDQGVILNIGHDSAGTIESSGNNFNTVENNHFYASGHHVLGVNSGKYNVVRNNYIHNEGWSTTGACADWATGNCGYRVVSMTYDGTGTAGMDSAGSNLIERNFIAYGAQYGGPHLGQGASGSGLTVATPSNIVRYNILFGNVLFGLRTGASLGSSSPADESHITNNTFYYNGWNMDSWGVVNEDDPALDAYGDDKRGALSLYFGSCGTGVDDVVVKNNLAHESWSETNRHSTNSTYYPAFNTSGVGACNTVENNWGNTGTAQGSPFTPWADPLFVDPDIDTPMDLVLDNGKWVGKPDLSLQSESPVIDEGTYLTSATGSGASSSTLVVNDAKYFQDGTWGSDLARSNLKSDWIAVGSVENAVEISSIDYPANTITLASPMSWDDNAPIWLYQKSDGERVLHGLSSDMGAFEYNAQDQNTPTPDGTSGGSGGGCFTTTIF